jgi:hypothetical protein
MKKILFVLMMAVSSITFAQNELKVISGSFDFIRDQTEINVELKFDQALYQVENLTEDQYLKKRKEDILKNPKKTNEDWQKWLGEWQRFKSSEYLKYFLKGANSKSKIVFASDGKAKYTLIIDAKWIYVGWHGGIMGQEAKLTSDMKVVETDNPSIVVLHVQGDKILGKPQNKDFVMEYGRIAGAFEATGKRFLGKEYKRALRK